LRLQSPHASASPALAAKILLSGDPWSRHLRSVVRRLGKNQTLVPCSAKIRVLTAGNDESLLGRSFLMLPEELLLPPHPFRHQQTCRPSCKKTFFFCSETCNLTSFASHFLLTMQWSSPLHFVISKMALGFTMSSPRKEETQQTSRKPPGLCPSSAYMLAKPNGCAPTELTGSHSMTAYGCRQESSGHTQQ